MIKAILKGLLRALMGLADVLLAPITALFTAFFPNFAEAITRFNFIVDNYLIDGISYFTSLIPPISRNLLVIYFGILISWYTLWFTYTSYLKVYAVLQKIKFW